MSKFSEGLKHKNKNSVVTESVIQKEGLYKKHESISVSIDNPTDEQKEFVKNIQNTKTESRVLKSWGDYHWNSKISTMIQSNAYMSEDTIK